jgi:hypothetical protein
MFCIYCAKFYVIILALRGFIFIQTTKQCKLLNMFDYMLLLTDMFLQLLVAFFRVSYNQNATNTEDV